MLNTYPFTLETYCYPSDAFEPYLDREIVNAHYYQHFANYVDQLNKLLYHYPSIQDWSLEKMLAFTNALPIGIRNAIVEYGGGAYNHDLYFSTLSPCGQNCPNDTLKQAIISRFSSLTNLKQYFLCAAKNLPGAGWAWLVSDKRGNLSLQTSYSQATPITSQQTPILGLDLWEHAYYLQYCSNKANYVHAWWSLLDWAKISDRYQAIIENYNAQNWANASFPVDTVNGCPESDQLLTPIEEDIIAYQPNLISYPDFCAENTPHTSNNYYSTKADYNHFQNVCGDSTPAHSSNNYYSAKGNCSCNRSF